MTDLVPPEAADAGANPQYVIGVLGGMGPAATVDFFNKLVQSTPASRDQEHRRVVIWSDPTVPDRTEALQGRAPDPTPWLLDGARRLQEIGATHIAIPCNTAHAFVPSLAARIGIPIVHMIDAVARRLTRGASTVRRVGLLATTGTVESGLYQDWLERRGVEVVFPPPGRQAALMSAIRAIKGGRRGATEAQVLAAVAHELVDGAGAEVIIAGCTEIPLCLTQEQVEVPLVDPARVLAEAMVELTSDVRPVR